MTDPTPAPIFLATLYTPPPNKTPLFLGYFYDAKKVPFIIRGKSEDISKFTARQLTSGLKEGEPVTARDQSAENLLVHGLRSGAYTVVSIASEKIAANKILRCHRQILQDLQT